MSRDQSEPSWPNAVPVSLEAGKGIQCPRTRWPHFFFRRHTEYRQTDRQIDGQHHVKRRICEWRRNDFKQLVITTRAAMVQRGGLFSLTIHLCVWVFITKMSLEPSEISSWNFYDKSSDKFENGCVLMHCSALVVIGRLWCSSWLTATTTVK